MAKFHPLTVAQVRRETDECVSILLHVPAELKEEYTFIQGQYLTFKWHHQGEEIRRNYSICRAPGDHELRVAVKKVPGGAFSTYANEQLKAGDTLEVMTPMGRFNCQLDGKNDKSYVAFAAGSGITPIMAHIRAVLQAEPQSRFTLIYGNKTTSSIIFREELEDLKNQHLGRFSLFHILSREAVEFPFLQGHIDAAKVDFFLKHFIPAADIDEAFVCGPAPLIEAVRTALSNAGLDRKQLHFELFASPQLQADSAAKRSAEKHTDGFAAAVTVMLDGVATHFTMGANDESILDAAMRHGADVPYACKGGVCATCRAHLSQGEVEMEVNYSLEHDELERGFILTCQSRPRSATVVVNFDEA